ncbi:prolipoprotein diacylglyceryl transferase [Miltoncostaea marina]|uniref:prolipoprotein diacylglyceryl transferase n=1 Tax=Miltoncostaea marina TaxID=2843215 RepID=UPI001C3C5D27|nr:prolipoprotein diacylglyceryl transferase [Miltoncostaea marina]
MNAAGLVATIPAPSIRDIELGPFEIRLYALCLLAGVAVASWLTVRRWAARGGAPDVVLEVTLWSVLAGLVGGRLYHVVTSWDQLGDEWYAPFAIWEGGLGIWGGVLFGVLAGALVCRLRGVSVLEMMDAAAPGILIAQGIGRLGNYFNQELFGGPTDRPWGLEVDRSRRPDEYIDALTFHPTFLYEMLWNFGGAALIIWAGHRFRIRPPGVFCLYVAVYSLGRIFWEQLRVDPSRELLGQRLNFYVALALLLGAIAVFVWDRRRRGPEEERRPPPRAGVPRAPGGRARPAGGRR